MKILVAGDIHYPREPEIFNKFLIKISREDYDLIFLCGDIVNYGNSELLKRFLKIVHKKTPAKIVAVMGNHDFWLSNNEIRLRRQSWDNISKYQKIFSLYGDVLLWDKPFLINDRIGIAGVPGWYDFSYANKKLGIPREIYLQGKYENLIWNDPRFTRFLESPEEITAINAENLKKQLEMLKEMKVKRAMVLLHFVPIRDFIIVKDEVHWDFWSAYLGSSVFGEIIMDYTSLISHTFFGHIDPVHLTMKKLVKQNTLFEGVDCSHSINNSIVIEI